MLKVARYAGLCRGVAPCVPEAWRIPPWGKFGRFGGGDAMDLYGDISRSTVVRVLRVAGPFFSFRHYGPRPFQGSTDPGAWVFGLTIATVSASAYRGVHKGQAAPQKYNMSKKPRVASGDTNMELLHDNTPEGREPNPCQDLIDWSVEGQIHEPCNETLQYCTH